MYVCARACVGVWVGTAFSLWATEVYEWITYAADAGTVENNNSLRRPALSPSQLNTHRRIILSVCSTLRLLHTRHSNSDAPPPTSAIPDGERNLNLWWSSSSLSSFSHQGGATPGVVWLQYTLYILFGSADRYLQPSPTPHYILTSRPTLPRRHVPANWIQ